MYAALRYARGHVAMAEPKEVSDWSALAAHAREWQTGSAGLDHSRAYRSPAQTRVMPRCGETERDRRNNRATETARVWYIGTLEPWQLQIDSRYMHWGGQESPQNTDNKQR